MYVRKYEELSRVGLFTIRIWCNGACVQLFLYICIIYNYIIDPCVVTIEYNFIALCTGFPACIVNN